MHNFDFTKSQLETLKQFLANPEEMIHSFLHFKDDIYLSFDYNADPISKFGGDWQRLAEGYTLWTSETEGEGGSLIEAGLPNITGSCMVDRKSDDTIVFNATYTSPNAFSASQKSGSSHTTTTKSGTSYAMDIIYFNANNGAEVKGIYGNATTVQPPAIKIYAWKRIG